MCRFLFKNDLREEELKLVLKTTSFKEINEFTIDKIEPDFNLGTFRFHINAGGFIYKLTIKNINEFWNFLEEAAISIEPILFYNIYINDEFFLYLEPIKKDFRFVIMDTVDISKKQKEGKIFRYSYKDCRVFVDVLINKKKFIKSFYLKMVSMFKKYENIAFFEPAIIDFNFWTKDSEILKKYIKHANSRK